jgi:phi LC3 family holin
MKINWQVRLKNKTFWLALIPAILLIAQIVTGWFGYDLAADLISAEVERLVNAIFAVLIILGVVNDPTTAGTSDSNQARTYKKPKKEAK